MRKLCSTKWYWDVLCASFVVLCLPQGYIIRLFSSIEIACAVRQAGPSVRALCEAVAVLVSKNITCARPRCNATPSEDFLHTSRCTLHAPHFTLHTSSHPKSCELFSPHLSSSHLIPSLLTCVREKSLAQKNAWAQKLLHTEA